MSLRQLFEEEHAQKDLLNNLQQSRLVADDKPSYYEEQHEVKLRKTPDFISTNINESINGGEEIRLNNWFDEHRRKEMLKLPGSKYHLILKYEKLLNNQLTRKYEVILITPELLESILWGIKTQTLFKQLYKLYPGNGVLRKVRISWLE